MTKRGEPLPINQALNRPRAKLGLDLTAWMAIVFVCVTVFLVGFRILAIVSFPMLVGGAWLGLAIVTTLAALFPANRAARLPVVDALRHV